MERKIGEIFEYNGEWYQCVKDSMYDFCQGCASFKNLKCTTFYSNIDCSLKATCKKLEKVGEPFSDEYFGLVQKYELEMYGYSTKDKRVCFADGYDVFIKIKQTKEDMEDLDKIKVRDYTKVEELNVMEEKKLNLKPFDIQKAREGKPVCTRDRRKTRIICFDSNGGRPIVALVTECDDEEEIPYKYHCDGSYNCQSIPSDNDLMMLPEKKEGWVNVYKERCYESKKEAIRHIAPGTHYIGTIKVEWEE